MLCLTSGTKPMIGNPLSDAVSDAKPNSILTEKWLADWQEGALLLSICLPKESTIKMSTINYIKNRVVVVKSISRINVQWWKECEHTQLPSLSIQKSPRTNDSGGRNVATHMPPLSIQISPRTNDQWCKECEHTHMPSLISNTSV